MNFSLFKKIIDEASEIGIMCIDLFLHGEPLIHPQLPEMLHYIKKKKLSVEIATNAMLLDKRKRQTILQSDLDERDVIRFSILGYTKETHELVQKGVNHTHVLTNVLDFLEEHKKIKGKKPRTKIAFYVTPENVHEIKQFKKFWKGKVNNITIKSESISFREYKTGKKPALIRRRYCGDLWNRMTIFWNGDVTICCLDVDGDYVFTNLERMTIKEAWNCEELLRIKKLFQEKKINEIPLCARCDF